MINYSHFGFHWEKPRISEKSFRNSDSVQNVKNCSLLKNFKGEGGRVLQLLGKKGLPGWQEIRQGSLINDWFIAALISVSRNPDRIMKNIL